MKKRASVTLFSDNSQIARTYSFLSHRRARNPMTIVLGFPKETNVLFIGGERKKKKNIESESSLKLGFSQVASEKKKEKLLLRIHGILDIFFFSFGKKSSKFHDKTRWRRWIFFSFWERGCIRVHYHRRRIARKNFFVFCFFLLVVYRYVPTDSKGYAVRNIHRLLYRATYLRFWSFSFFLPGDQMHNFSLSLPIRVGSSIGSEQSSSRMFFFLFLVVWDYSLYQLFLNKILPFKTNR